MKKLILTLAIAVFACNGFAYYSSEQGRWISRDPIEEQGGENLYAMVQNCPISKTDFLGLFEIYTHSRGWGHVGITDDSGTTYDYGRYRGTYSGKGGLHAGPNILKKSTATPNADRTFHFNVCPELEKKITQVLGTKLNSGSSVWPEQVKMKFRTQPAPLSSNERYMGSDWSTSDNCMTFTFSALVGAVKQVADDPKATKTEKEQAKVLINLAWSSVWDATPDGVTGTLDRYASKYNWISSGGGTSDKKDDPCCGSSK